MAEGGWVVLGAAVGTLGTVITTVLNAWLAKSKPDYFEKRAMKLLNSVLSQSEAPWHSLSHLSNIVGLNPKDTRELLLMIGARGHESGSDAWALISRVGVKDLNSALPKE